MSWFIISKFNKIFLLYTIILFVSIFALQVINFLTEYKSQEALINVIQLAFFHTPFFLGSSVILIFIIVITVYINELYTSNAISAILSIGYTHIWIIKRLIMYSLILMVIFIVWELYILVNSSIKYYNVKNNTSIDITQSFKPTIFNKINNIQFYFYRSDNKGIYHNILIHEILGAKSQNIIYAKKAYITETRYGLFLILNNGYIHNINNNKDIYIEFNIHTQMIQPKKKSIIYNRNPKVAEDSYFHELVKYSLQGPSESFSYNQHRKIVNKLFKVLLYSTLFPLYTTIAWFINCRFIQPRQNRLYKLAKTIISCLLIYIVIKFILNILNPYNSIWKLALVPTILSLNFLVIIYEYLKLRKYNISN